MLQSESSVSAALDSAPESPAQRQHADDVFSVQIGGISSTYNIIYIINYDVRVCYIIINQ